MDKIIVYSVPNCPKCKLLKERLREHCIEFEINEDTQYMIKELHLKSVPYIDVKGKLYDFSEALKWIKKSSGGI